ncbi:hypothetical protein C5167_042986 [Papaver somniferum]|uniref:F-box protein n=1 Tax=Papaver somniferum TaxID=3469 RepID=A0A4Y7L7P4_PAPSO|nr:probable F-box protein At4g22030 [Papaver somniferum]RZC80401.1 hypothetical protein C5167_042986 [Papaver somniferum]
MATLQVVSNLLCSSHSSSTVSQSRKGVQAAIHFPKLNNIRKPYDLNLPSLTTKASEPMTNITQQIMKTFINSPGHGASPTLSPTLSPTTLAGELYMIMEAIAERIEMHQNIGDQRNNWNTLLLNSINAITIAAATMTGLGSTGVVGSSSSLLALQVTSTLLYTAATGMLVVMNTIQPSQLAEEQRNATRLFRQLHEQIKTKLSLSRTPITQRDVNQAMKKVLALDKAYPLPLLGGVMIEKFPKNVEPANWWPEQSPKEQTQVSNNGKAGHNGWSSKLEKEMRGIVELLRTRDTEEYIRLSNMMLKINKTLAIAGPLLTGLGALGAAFAGSPSNGSVAVLVGVTAGAMATVVNTMEHGGQIGMIFEMYRASAGSFQLLEETIESTLEEPHVEKREHGKLFEMKVALQLGRSLSDLRNFSGSLSPSRPVTKEFASKLF